MKGSLSTPFGNAPATPSQKGEGAINNVNPCIPGHGTDADVIDHKMYEDISYNEAALNTPFVQGLGITNTKK